MGILARLRLIDILPLSPYLSRGLIWYVTTRSDPALEDSWSKDVEDGREVWLILDWRRPCEGLVRPNV